jgi:hypothetical protein
MNLKATRTVNYYQIMAIAIVAVLVMVFAYIFALSDIINPPGRQVVAENEIVEVAAGDYSSMMFSVPMEFGIESIDLQFQVVENLPSNDGVNIFVSDSLGRFECEKKRALSPAVSDTIANDCLSLITIIEKQSLNVTSGSIEGPIREGTFYLVIDNISSQAAKQVQVSLAVMAD